MKNKKENIDLVNIIFNLRIYTERVKRYNSGSPIFGDTFKSLKISIYHYPSKLREDNK